MLEQRSGADLGELKFVVDRDDERNIRALGRHLFRPNWSEIRQNTGLLPAKTLSLKGSAISGRAGLSGGLTSLLAAAILPPVL
jgi:hypothetical protein